MKDKHIISIAGTVGIGKSTFARHLSDRLGYEVAYENVDNNPYLDKYYQDFNRWAFHLQIFFLAERFKMQKAMSEKNIGYIQDRTIYEDVDIFAKLNFHQGKMTEEDYQTYRSLFEAMVLTPHFPAPDLIIYLESDLDTVLSRIQERGREMEVKTDVEYWQTLHNYYHEWIHDFNHAPVLRLSINDYDVDDAESFDRIVNMVKAKLNIKK